MFTIPPGTTYIPGFLALSLGWMTLPWFANPLWALALGLSSQTRRVPVEFIVALAAWALGLTMFGVPRHIFTSSGGFLPIPRMSGVWGIGSYTWLAALTAQVWASWPAFGVDEASSSAVPDVHPVITPPQHPG